MALLAWYRKYSVWKIVHCQGYYSVGIWKILNGQGHRLLSKISSFTRHNVLYIDEEYQTDLCQLWEALSWASLQVEEQPLLFFCLIHSVLDVICELVPDPRLVPTTSSLQSQLVMEANAYELFITVIFQSPYLLDLTPSPCTNDDGLASCQSIISFSTLQQLKSIDREKNNVYWMVSTLNCKFWYWFWFWFWGW